VLAEIGRGGMGVVYRAQDLKLDREVALKVVSPDLVRDDDLERRFVLEARSAAALSHPAITVVHEIDTADGVTFIAMELVRGESLAARLARQPLPLPSALDLAIEIAGGLAEGHERGVVHRDLKPSNVMVTDSGRAKIIDFGLAKPARPRGSLDSGADTPARGPLGADSRMPTAPLSPSESPGTGAGRLIGTAAYMSPEQAAGGAVDARSDIFSFGALLHELLSGRPPFRRATIVETLHAVLKDSAPPLPPLEGAAGQADLQRILDKCLAKDPAQRYQGAPDLVVDLRAARRQHDAGLGALSASHSALRVAPGPLRVAIVDDEEPARALLREYLALESEVEIVAECRNGFEAVKAVAECRPDLVFLDIQMPKLDGFEVLELIGGDVPVVFVTAFDEHAVRAFEVNAVDYLLKPLGPERLSAALARVRQRLAHSAPAHPVPVAELISAARPERGQAARILVRDGARVHVIPVDRLDYAQAQDDYVCLRAEGRDHLKQQTLADLERSLDATRFVRIHRSYLLNVERLAKLETEGKDTRVAILRDGTRLPVSRSGFARLRALL